MDKSKVYMTTEITPESLVKMYEALQTPAHGKVAVKISTGEPGGHNYLKPELIGLLVKKLDATIVECNTIYTAVAATLKHTSRQQKIMDLPRLRRWILWMLTER